MPAGSWNWTSPSTSNSRRPRAADPHLAQGALCLAAGGSRDPGSPGLAEAVVGKSAFPTLRALLLGFDPPETAGERRRGDSYATATLAAWGIPYQGEEGTQSGKIATIRGQRWLTGSLRYAGWLSGTLAEGENLRSFQRDPLPTERLTDRSQLAPARSPSPARRSEPPGEWCR